MLMVKEATTLVGISELRTKLDEILRAMGRSTVVIERRHKPVAVLMPVEKYERMESLLDWIEDQALGFIAKERAKGTPRKAYLSSEELKRRLRID